MKTSRILPAILALVALTTTTSFAQKSYKWGKKKCAAITITDAGELYSTYDLGKEIETLKTNAKLTQAQAEEILANCNESSWSGGMASLDDRVDNHDIMQKFKAFVVGKIGNNYVLIIPSKLNQGLANNFSQPKDIFIVIGGSGVNK